MTCLGLDARFQSTPSAWRETCSWCGPLAALRFQSTPSAWRETDKIVNNHEGCTNFNPLPPHGGRHNSYVCVLCICTFQSTPSAWRETDSRYTTYNAKTISIHSLRMEGDCFHLLSISIIAHFNPLPPHGGRPHFLN